MIKLFHKLKNFLEHNENFFVKLKKFEEKIVNKLKDSEENELKDKKSNKLKSRDLMG